MGFKESWKQFWQKEKRTKLFLVGLVGAIAAILGAWELLYTFDQDPFNGLELPLISGFDEYSWILLILGGIMAVGGFLYFHDHNKNYKRFRELMDTDSKASFVRNIDEIEELAIDLGPQFEEEVMEKRRHFKVKTR